MIYKYLAILLFLGFTSPSWCQKSRRAALEDKPVRAEMKRISGNQSNTTKKDTIVIKDSIYFCNKDTILNYDIVDKNIIINCDTMRNFIIEKACEYIGVITSLFTPRAEGDLFRSILSIYIITRDILLVLVLFYN